MPRYIWKNLKKDEDLECDSIPDNAITLKKTHLHKVVLWLYFVTTLLFTYYILFATRYQNGHLYINRLAVVIGCILGISFGVVHEILHGIVMPRDSIVYIGLNNNWIGMYEYCARATKKSIFIISSALPLILGVVPTIAFLVISENHLILSGLLWGFGASSLITVCPDIADIVYMIIHVPNNHYIQPGNDFYVYYKPADKG